MNLCLCLYFYLCLLCCCLLWILIGGNEPWIRYQTTIHSFSFHSFHEKTTIFECKERHSSWAWWTLNLRCRGSRHSCAERLKIEGNFVLLENQGFREVIRANREPEIRMLDKPSVGRNLWWFSSLDLSMHTLKSTGGKGMPEGSYSREGVPSLCSVL